MSKSKIVFTLLACLTALFYACKKEVITDKQAALQQLVGRWPLKYKIREVINGSSTLKDTTVYNPVDTLVFSVDGTYIKTNKTIIQSGKFSIDEAGEHITFIVTPSLTQKFSYIRASKIGLVVSDQTVAGVRTITVDELSR